MTAPVVVDTTIWDANNGATLGIPRWKGYVSELNPNEFWLSYANGGGARGNLLYTLDRGDTWSSPSIQIQAYLDMHVSLSGRGGELFFTAPGAASVFFRKVHAPAHSAADLEPVRTIANTTGMHRSSITVQDTGRIWVFTRLSSDANENVLYHYSDDDGVNWTTDVAYATGWDTIRIGSMPYVGGRPALVVLYLADPRGFEYYLWNGTQFEAAPDHTIYAANMGQTRVFTHNVVGSDIFHLVFGLGTQLHHVWKAFNGGQGSWNHAVIDNSAQTVDNDWFPTSTAHGNDLYVFYCKKSSSDFASSMVYYKRWDQQAQTWTDPVLVSTASGNTHNRDPNTSFQVPVAANYIPVFWHSGPDGTGQQINFARIDLH